MSTHILCTSPHVSLDSMLPSSGVVRLRVFSSYVVEAYGGVTEELLQLGDSLDLHDSNQNLLHKHNISLGSDAVTVACLGRSVNNAISPKYSPDANLHNSSGGELSEA